MMKTNTLAALAAVAIATAACAGAPTKTEGGVLTDSKGMTLYTFDKDMNGKSACNGGCAKNWPPLTAAGESMGSGEYATINRDDGTRQWTYKGKPLYAWTKDQKPGDKTGDGFLNGAWHVAMP
jgi:predicted lipoprotein with Yx(FWY)xxD motif